MLRNSKGTRCLPLIILQKMHVARDLRITTMIEHNLASSLAMTYLAAISTVTMWERAGGIGEGASSNDLRPGPCAALPRTSMFVIEHIHLARPYA